MRISPRFKDAPTWQIADFYQISCSFLFQLVAFRSVRPLHLPHVDFLTDRNPEYLFLPETARLTLEEIAAKFGDAVAVDLSHLSEERRKALDESLMAVGADVITDSPPNGGKAEVAFTEKS